MCLLKLNSFWLGKLSESLLLHFMFISNVLHKVQFQFHKELKIFERRSLRTFSNFHMSIENFFFCENSMNQMIIMVKHIQNLSTINPKAIKEYLEYVIEFFIPKVNISPANQKQEQK